MGTESPETMRRSIWAFAAQAKKRCYASRNAATMVQDKIIHVEKRDVSGTKNVNKAMRKDGWLPAVINTQGEYEHIKISMKDLTNAAQKEDFYSTMFCIGPDYDGTGAPKRVLPQRVDIHPVTDELVHAWFLGYQPGAQAKVKLPLILKGADRSPGLKAGGWTMVLTRKIECMCDMDNIPRAVPIDISNTDKGECVRMQDVDWQALGTRPIRFDPKQAIVKVVLK